MDIVRHPRDLDRAFRPCVAALGNFDGFHRGHQ
ncbi:MAG: bifunctional riboflavin kinase/FAD synthetase, partial [Alphaproteobacteria bacterium]